MRCFMRYKTVITTFVMALLILVMGSTAEAVTINRKITNDTEIVYVGDETSMTGNSIKINGKKLSKMKKKVKAVSTGYDDYYGSYLKSSYYNESSAYKAGKSKSDGYRYYKGTDYTFRFLKTGTYKISKVDYSNYFGYYNVYQMVSTRSEYVNGEWQSYYKLQKISYSEENGYEYKDVGSEEYLYKTIDVEKDASYYTDYSYYQGVNNKKIYAYGDHGITAASFKNGADGKKHLYYDAIVVKTTTVDVYKAVKESKVVTSVQLGKSKYSYKDGRSGYSTNGTITVKKFLSGKSGKVKVKMGSNYSLQSIVVVTYDKEGNEIYQLVGNNKSVTYGAYKYQYSYKSSYSTYSYSRATMYKPTEVYVFYKNNNTKAYTKIKNIEKDEYGDYKITYERGYEDGSKSEYTNYGYLPSNYRVSYTFYKK